MAEKIKKETLHTKGIDIEIYTEDYQNEYISLTDIAKYRNGDDPRFVIQNWMVIFPSARISATSFCIASSV